jgi:hypothetical protein
MSDIERVLTENGFDETGVTLSFVFSSKGLWYADCLQKGLKENKISLSEVKRLLDAIRMAENQYVNDEDYENE